MDTDYFVLDTSNGQWPLSAAMARVVEAQLDRWPPRRWVSFVDLTGARVRLRAELVLSMSQCYAENRAAERTLRRRIAAETEEV